LAREQRLAPPWTVQTAADMIWALMSFDLLEELLVDRGWSSRRYRTYLAALLRSTFLCDPGRSQAAPRPALDDRGSGTSRDGGSAGGA